MLSLGFGVSAARLGLPDTGFISYGEMVDQGLQITQAVSIPVIGDGDNGYGNAMNVKRTIKGYIKAGFAGIILEDQVRIIRDYVYLYMQRPSLVDFLLLLLYVATLRSF